MDSKRIYEKEEENVSGGEGSEKRPTQEYSPFAAPLEDRGKQGKPFEAQGKQECIWLRDGGRRNCGLGAGLAAVKAAASRRTPS